MARHAFPVTGHERPVNVGVFCFGLCSRVPGAISAQRRACPCFHAYTRPLRDATAAADDDHEFLTRLGSHALIV